MKREVDLVLDSGAFTAWRQEKSIDLDRYIQFIHDHEEHLWHYVNLDTIPGRYKVTRTPEQTEEAARLSFRNLEVMTKNGLDPMPVFHQGERFYWLEKMLDFGCSYIGLSPVNRAGVDQKCQWLDEVFGLLCNNDQGMPCVKTHAFGLTSPPLLLRYPWYSADSVSWLLGGGFGRVFIPRILPDGSYDYSVVETPEVSHVGDSAGVRKGSHLDHYGLTLRAALEKYLAKAAPGISLQDIRDTRAARTTLNAIYFRDLSRNRKLRPFTLGGAGLFGSTMKRHKTKPIKLPEELIMIFTISNAAPDSNGLQDHECRHRLVTYWNWVIEVGFDIPAYVRTGRLGRYQKEQTK
jgi:hypothetical protein